MGALTKSFKTNEQKEQEGIWVDCAVNDDKTIARIRVRRLGPSNKPFAKRLAILNKKFRSMRGDKQELEAAAFRTAFIETAIVAWENIENINEVPAGMEREPYMPFTHENAEKLFKALPELLDFVASTATEIEAFQDTEQVPNDVVKNSLPSSNIP